MHETRLRPWQTVLYNVAFYGTIGGGLALLGYQYFRSADLDGGAGATATFVATSGYALIAAGILVSILIALLRWRTAEVDDGRRPTFTAGIAILAIGAVLMVASLLAKVGPGGQP